jgi:DNA polymerase V
MTNPEASGPNCGFDTEFFNHSIIQSFNFSIFYSNFQISKFSNFQIPKSTALSLSLCPMKLRPIHQGPLLEFYAPDYSTALDLPYIDAGLRAGFPSPADDFIELRIDINKEYIKNRDTTFFARVKGNSMVNAGIFDGDLLIIDKSLEPQNNKIAVCQIDGAFTVKRIKIEQDVVWLIAENENYQPIKVTPENELMIWGIVTASIKKF